MENRIRSLLREFDERDLAQSISIYLHQRSKFWPKAKCLPSGVAINSGVFTLNPHSIAGRAEGAIPEQIQANIYLLELALFKALRLLAKTGNVEFVSLTMTKTTPGIVHLPTGTPYRLQFHSRALSRIEPAFGDVRHIKYGDPVL